MMFGLYLLVCDKWKELNDKVEVKTYLLVLEVLVE